VFFSSTFFISLYRPRIGFLVTIGVNLVCPIDLVGNGGCYAAQTMKDIEERLSTRMDFRFTILAASLQRTLTVSLKETLQELVKQRVDDGNRLGDVVAVLVLLLMLVEQD